MRKISRLGFALIATVSASLVTGCTSVDENKTYASGERIVEALIAGGLTCDDPSIVDNQVDWGGSGVAYEELSCATAGGDHSYAIQRYYSTSDLKRDIEWN
ncbi:MAG: hypothetical protein KGL77_06740, partial [Actinomycetales bacterium]|nr:hypothetical protein [Actinomycetales bacterium]